jgi:lipopolysaccharide export system permease protein
MKKTLYLYICKEIAVPFLLGMMTFTSVLLIGRLMKLADFVVGRGVPFTDVVRLVVYLLPYFTIITIPMAFLLALLLAFGRLSADSEITAFKACGVGLSSLLPPVIGCALFAYILTAAIAVWAIPWGNSSFKKLVYDSLQSRANLSIREAVFNDDFPGMVLYVDRYDRDREIMSGILIQDERNPSEPTTVFAESGRLTADPSTKVVRLQLLDGSIHRTTGKNGYRMIQFHDYDLSINLATTATGIKRDELDMSLSELRTSMNAPQSSAKLRLDMVIEFHRRFALPFACIVFVFIGMPLGIQNQRSGKAAGFAISIGVLLLYYILLSAGKTCGERGILPPAVAVWSPNIIFLAFGGYLFKKTAEEQRFFLFVLASTTMSSIKSAFSGRRVA